MSLVVASFVCSGLSFLYAGTLAIMRHGTFEDSGVLDSLLEVLVSAVPVGLLYSTPTLIFASPFFSFYLCRQMYLKYVAGVMFTSTNQEGKVFIITGSNTGIGFVTARELVRMGATVVLACRSIKKANDAKELILKEVKVSETKVMVIQLDLCDFESVRAFVKAFEATGLPLHCLINNAGVMTTERSITKMGYEMVFTANHLSHFLLTNLLLPHLIASKGRVVNLTSSLHKACRKFNFEDIQSEKNFSLFGSYSQSKLANVLFTFELQRRMDKNLTGVNCYAVHPGLVLTEVTRNMPYFMRLGDKMLYPLMCLLRKTPLQGASTTIHVATSLECEIMGGKYFFHCSTAPAGNAAYSTEDARQLWEHSEKLTSVE